MTRDILSEATRALREASSGHDECAKLTRARVLSGVRDREKRRRKLSAFLIPIAAVLVGSTAFASATGKLPGIVQQVKSAVGWPAERIAPPDEPAPPVRAPLRAGEAPPARDPAPAPEAPAPPAPEPVKQAAPELKPEPAAHPMPVAPSNDGDVLYRAAHSAHFVERNPSSALTKWDAYLAAAPRGRFSTEARYNRALCLVRLGRSAEAAAALEPFAKGAFGGYRQSEAQSLIDAIQAKR